MRPSYNYSPRVPHSERKVKQKGKVWQAYVKIQPKKVQHMYLVLPLIIKAAIVDLAN